MKKFRIPFENKRRLQALAAMRRLRSRRGKTDGAEFISSALSQLKSGDAESAYRSIERFELTASGLTNVDLASVQEAKEGLKASRWRRFRALMATAIFGLVAKFGITAAWHLIIALLHNYFWNDGVCQDVGDRTVLYDRYARGRFEAPRWQGPASIPVLGRAQEGREQTTHRGAVP